MNSWPPESLDARVRAAALGYGFDAVGVAVADQPLTEDYERYEAFVAAGMHGEMGWLAESAEVRRRVDTADILEGARSVLCVGMRYGRLPEEEASDAPTARTIARYARGRDYHNGMRKKLRQLAAFLRRLGTSEDPVHARPLLDDAPLLERAWAARAGLGFIGKNGLLIVPGQGSLLLLGEVVTTLRLTPDEPMQERCGSCTRCLDACPTGAFARPFVLDPRRCISYLTIEKRGPIPVELRSAIGDHLFGCDDCQTVCPFNKTSQRAGPRFEPHPRWSSVSLGDALAADQGAWSKMVEGSPVHRATQAGLARNAAIVLGNKGDPSALPALEDARREHPSDVVRDAASWAIETLLTRDVLEKAEG